MEYEISAFCLGDDDDDVRQDAESKVLKKDEIGSKSNTYSSVSEWNRKPNQKRSNE